MPKRVPHPDSPLSNPDYTLHSEEPENPACPVFAQVRRGFFEVGVLHTYSKQSSGSVKLRSLQHKIMARPVVERVESPIPRRFNHTRGERSEQLIADYKAGMPVKEIAAKYGIHRGSVSKHLAVHGVPPRKVGLDAEQIQEAVKLYARGGSLAAIGKQMGVDKGTVRERLVESGVAMRSPYEHLRP